MPAELKPAPYADRYVEAGGLRLHYLDYGQEGRPVMLCLHGGQAHAHWYDFVASAFTPDNHLLALDARGHGDSEWSVPPDYTYERFADDLNEVAENLDLQDFTLVGHSIGGVVAAIYATKYPGRMKRMIIVDATYTTSPERVAAMKARADKPKPSFATKDELVAAYKLNPPENVAPPEVFRHLASLDAIEGPDGQWRQKFDPQFYAQRELNHGFEIWDNIKVPVLLMKAAQSNRLSPKVIAEIKAHCPQAETIEIAGCDHHVMLDNPDDFVAAVKAFVAAN